MSWVGLIPTTDQSRDCSQRQHQGHFGPTVGRRKIEDHGKEGLPLTSVTIPEHWAWKNSLPTPPPSHFSLPRNNLEVRQERRLVTSTVWQLVSGVNLAGSRTPAIYASGHAWMWGGLLVGVRRPTHCEWHHFLARIVNCRKQRKHEHQLAFRSLCFLFADVMWPAASSSCSFLLQDGLHPWSGSWISPFGLKLLQLGYCLTAMEKKLACKVCQHPSYASGESWDGDDPWVVLHTLEHPSLS